MDLENDPSLVNLRSKGLKTYSGKIHKGCVKDAFTKLSIGSIPSNNQSIVYHHEFKKGFGTSQKRFYQESHQRHDAIPQIQLDDQQDRKKVLHTSYSTRGYGPLIAKQQRPCNKKKKQWNPGPGEYFKLHSQSQVKKRKNKNYNRQRQQQKIKQILKHKQTLNIPGPGQYQINQINKSKLVGFKSSFVTKDDRKNYIPKSQTPGPGWYDTKNISLQTNKKRQNSQEDGQNQTKPTPKYFLNKKKQFEVPGPGYYDSEIPTFKPLYERVKVSNNFVYTNKDRIDQMFNSSKDKISPNPCSYDIPSKFNQNDKKSKNLPCFLSQSKRQPFNQIGYGPNLNKKIQEQIRKNFHFNIRGEWV